MPFNSVKHGLWRAADTNIDVLDILVQAQRHTKAAKRFMARPIIHFGHPQLAIADKLHSDVRPISHQAPDADHRAHKGLQHRRNMNLSLKNRRLNCRSNICLCTNYFLPNLPKDKSGRTSA
ncbi:DDE-type integrase/transposase/recombinase [Hoeflea ulvae]|uniref:DDE-type integrase/transposase/recombinase n=1 Tax=Hoeflea ulvae TaxID=2983764 RepID=UPI003CCD0D8C